MLLGKLPSNKLDNTTLIQRGEKGIWGYVLLCKKGTIFDV